MIRMIAGGGFSLLMAFGCGGGGVEIPSTLPPEATESVGNDAPTTPPEVIAVRMLVVSYQGAPGGRPTERTQAQALERARMLSMMARQGDTLADLIAQYSDVEGGEERGVIKLRTATPAPFDEAVVKTTLALPVGGVSDPLEGPGGYLVFERMPDPPAGPERVGARHILIAYSGSAGGASGVTRSQSEAEELAQKVVELARAEGADWDALAAEYTEEPGGKERAGDLGKFGRGQMVPPFERAVFALPVGGISDVVETQFGYHVIQRYE